MNRQDAASATASYLRKRSRHRFIGFTVAALLLASIMLGHSPDDWACFDHRSVHVTGASGNLLNLSTGQTVQMLGIVSADSDWMRVQTVGRDVTLLLQSPQTRDAAGNLLAFAFLDNQNLSVEAVKEGMARADRREKSLFDGLIRPAEAEARKKMRGMWGNRNS